MRGYSVPLTLINLQDDGFHLLVEIVVFGQRHLAVVDTGASRTVFDQTLVKTHVPESDWSGETEATTLFSTSSSIQTLIPQIGIGPAIKVQAYEAVCLDLMSVNTTYQQLGHPAIAAIIGGDILLKYQARIDYKKLRLYLYK
jgi:hypothetical protein